MRTALFIALVGVAACRGKHDKEVIIVGSPAAVAAPNTNDVDPTAPTPAGNPTVPPVAAAPAPAPAPTAIVAEGSAAMPAAAPSRDTADAGVDANDSNGLVP